MPLVPLSEVQDLVLDACAPSEVVDVPLAAARGLVLAAPVRAEEPVPPFDNTAMDGFAVVASDTAGATDAEPVRLSVVGTQPAGLDRALRVGPGEAVRIMTGAPMPAGADAVVMVERTEVTAEGDDVETVAIGLEVGSGTNVRRAGDDLRAGATVLERGTVLSPAALGVLASVGRADVAVHRRPVVGVLSTGDELVPAGRPLRPGEIRDSNRAALVALVERDGFDAVDLGLLADDEDEIEAAIVDAATRCDALVSSGGVSMGDFDYVKVVLDRLAEMRWLQIAIKPAKPFAFGVLSPPHRPIPVFGLPGNPVSSMVSYELLARPGLRALSGHPAPLRPTVRATATEALRRRADGKTHFARVRCEWSSERSGYEVRPSGGQGSHQLAAMAAADGLAVLVDGDGVAVGGEVDVLLCG